MYVANKIMLKANNEITKRLSLKLTLTTPERRQRCHLTSIWCLYWLCTKLTPISSVFVTNLTVVVICIIGFLNILDFDSFSNVKRESAKWRPRVLACFVCFARFKCLACLTCFMGWRAWHAYMLGMLHEMMCLLCLKKLTSLVCFIT